MKSNNWCRCWLSKLSQLTNHSRVYQQLVYTLEWGIENNSYKLHYSVSSQPSHGFCPIFLNPHFSLSWNLEQAKWGIVCMANQHLCQSFNFSYNIVKKTYCMQKISVIKKQTTYSLWIFFYFRTHQELLLLVYHDHVHVIQEQLYKHKYVYPV